MDSSDTNGRCSVVSGLSIDKEVRKSLAKAFDQDSKRKVFDHVALQP